MLGNLLFQFTHFSDYQVSRFSILNGPQRKCVLDVVVFLRDDDDLNTARIDRAIRGCWNTGLPADGA